VVACLNLNKVGSDLTSTSTRTQDQYSFSLADTMTLAKTPVRTTVQYILYTHQGIHTDLPNIGISCLVCLLSVRPDLHAVEKIFEVHGREEALQDLLHGGCFEESEKGWIQTSYYIPQD
jgi:hypothetical protein